MPEIIVPTSLLGDKPVDDLMLVYWMLRGGRWHRQEHSLQTSVRSVNNWIWICGIEIDDQKKFIRQRIWCPMDLEVFEFMQKHKMIQMQPSVSEIDEWILSESGELEAQQKIRQLLKKLPGVLKKQNLPHYPDPRLQLYVRDVVEKAISNGRSLMDMLLIDS